MNKFRIALGAMALVMAVVAVTSCNKERDLKYSCNPKINRWVLKNVESIAAASRQQLAVLPLDFQKASYLTLSPERKYELWNEKLELVKANWDEPVQNMIVDYKIILLSIGLTTPFRWLILNTSKVGNIRCFRN